MKPPRTASRRSRVGSGSSMRAGAIPKVLGACWLESMRPVLIVVREIVGEDLLEPTCTHRYCPDQNRQVGRPTKLSAERALLAICCVVSPRFLANPTNAATHSAAVGRRSLSGPLQEGPCESTG